MSGSAAGGEWDKQMTPFGERVRQLRQERGRMLKDMAAHLGVSSAYLSALERGERGKPTWTLLQGVLQYFHIIWDEADELARLADLSDPKVKIDTAASSPKATLLANRLAREIRGLSAEELDAMLAILDRAQERERKAATEPPLSRVGEGQG
jgi:transcriptional regulator with XRE-family HTH domain